MSGGHKRLTLNEEKQSQTQSQDSRDGMGLGWDVSTLFKPCSGPWLVRAELGWSCSIAIVGTDSPGLD